MQAFDAEAFVRKCFSEHVHSRVNDDDAGELAERVECLVAELSAAMGGRGDDAEPVTEEWLISEGWEPRKHRGVQDRWEKDLCIQRHEDEYGETRHWLVVHRSCDGDWWPIDLRQQFVEDDADGQIHREDGVALLSWVAPTTRGHVRNIIAALGIPLPAAPGERSGE